MNIDDLKVGELKQIAALLAGAKPQDIGAWEIGKIYLIRTVTMIDTGKVVAVGEHEIVLEDAAWIADTGRFSEALTSATFGEVEPFPEGKVIIGRGSIIDAVQIKLAPRSRK